MPNDLTLAVIEAKLNLLLAIIARMEQKENEMALSLDALTAQVAANTTVEQSAITLINGLAAQITAAAGDPAKVSALADQLKTSATALAAAITANTPPVTTGP
jgi:pyridoxine 5'-phosphate synthase PdxJ